MSSPISRCSSFITSPSRVLRLTTSGRALRPKAVELAGEVGGALAGAANLGDELAIGIVRARLLNAISPNR